MMDRVSCLCVTRGPWLPNALLQFDRQTYANRELVVVHQGLPVGVCADLKERGANVVFAGKRLRLGQLRNLAVEAATGQWCIQWDDDDMFHPKRIETQLQRAIEMAQEAQFLTSWFMRDTQTGDVFRSFRRLWEGSLLARRWLLLKHPYDTTVTRGEDSAQARAMLEHAKPMVGILDAPHLYLYQAHGANTWPAEHFKALFERSELLNPMQAAEVLRGFE